MFADKKNQRIAMFAVFAILVIILVLYFGYIYGFLAGISDKERQQLRDLEAKMPELSSVIGDAEEDGKITTLEYWEIVDAYREKQQEEYKKTLQQ